MSSNTTNPPNNRAILNTAQLIKAVMSSASEAKLGALYINATSSTHQNGPLSAPHSDANRQHHHSRGHQQQHSTATNNSNGYEVSLAQMPRSTTAVLFFLASRQNQPSQLLHQAPLLSASRQATPTNLDTTKCHRCSASIPTTHASTYAQLQICGSSSVINPQIHNNIAVFMKGCARHPVDAYY